MHCSLSLCQLKTQVQRKVCLPYRRLREQKWKERDGLGNVSEKAGGIKRVFSLYVPQDLTLGTYLLCPCCRSVNGWHHNSLRRGCLLRLLSQVHHYADSLTPGSETKQPPSSVDQSSDARTNPESISTALIQPSERTEEGL